MLILFFSLSIDAQNKKEPLIYNPDLDVSIQLDSAIAKAMVENKNVLIQIGGNWCSWCLKFHKFVIEDEELSGLLDSNYVYILMNIDRKHKQHEMMGRLRFPNRFGFPVFVILNNEGEYLHTQNSALLEKGKSYDRKKVKNFLMNWTVKALSPESYK